MIASYHPRGIDDDGGFDQDSLNSNHVDDDVNVTEDKVIKLIISLSRGARMSS